MDPKLYYRPSGKAPVIGVMLAMIVGSIGGTVLAVIYSLINYYNPFIYFTFIATGLFGAGCGVCAVFGLSLGKVRSPMMNALAGFFVGFVSLYLSWVVYLFLVAKDSFGQGILMFDMQGMWSFMQVIAETGLWEIGGAAPTGMALYAIWALEAGIIIVPSVLIAYASDTPFCEGCKAWADEKVCGVTFASLEDLESMKDSLEEGDYRPLLEQGRMEPEADALHVKIHSCPKCDESTWLEIDRVLSWVDDKGEDQSSSENVVKYLSIERPEATALLSLNPEDFGNHTEENSPGEMEAPEQESEEDPENTTGES